MDVELNPALMLQKQLIVPHAAKAKLARTVELDVRQSLPGGGDDLVWVSTIEKREGSNLHVIVYLIKRKTLEQIEELLASKNAIARTISVSGGYKLKPLIDHRRVTDRSRRVWDIVLVLLLVLSFGLVFWGELRERAELQARISLLQQQKTELSTGLLSLREKLENESSSYSAILNDANALMSEHQRLHAILDLTEVLDDKTWISELVFSGSNLRLSGFTGDEITSVIDAIRPLGWVNRVDISGPITFDTYTRKNRFDLSVSTNKAGVIDN